MWRLKGAGGIVEGIEGLVMRVGGVRGPWVMVSRFESSNDGDDAEGSR